MDQANDGFKRFLLCLYVDHEPVEGKDKINPISSPGAELGSKSNSADDLSYEILLHVV